MRLIGLEPEEERGLPSRVHYMYYIPHFLPPRHDSTVVARQHVVLQDRLVVAHGRTLVAKVFAVLALLLCVLFRKVCLPLGLLARLCNPLACLLHLAMLFELPILTLFPWRFTPSCSRSHALNPKRRPPPAACAGQMDHQQVSWGLMSCGKEI